MFDWNKIDHNHFGIIYFPVNFPIIRTAENSHTTSSSRGLQIYEIRIFMMFNASWRPTEF